MDLSCIDCRAPIVFPSSGDATCRVCGLAQYVNDEGGQGRYPSGVGLNPLGQKQASPYLTDDGQLVDDLEQVVAVEHPDRTPAEVALACKVMRDRVAQGVPPTLTDEQRRQIGTILSAPTEVAS